ncbi:MAG: hypothetical protein A4E28_00177 [Methanocella sp. PtaU1.Bin125]|nr:MAG: hypothetical protein A4E28_00177 [Methanocella sp. PtaU1.Bin125]
MGCPITVSPRPSILKAAGFTSRTVSSLSSTSMPSAMSLISVSRATGRMLNSRYLKMPQKNRTPVTQNATGVRSTLLTVSSPAV